MAGSASNWFTPTAGPRKGQAVYLSGTQQAQALLTAGHNRRVFADLSTRARLIAGMLGAGDAGLLAAANRVRPRGVAKARVPAPKVAQDRPHGHTMHPDGTATYQQGGLTWRVGAGTIDDIASDLAFAAKRPVSHAEIMQAIATGKTRRPAPASPRLGGATSAKAARIWTHYADVVDDLTASLTGGQQQAFRAALRRGLPATVAPDTHGIPGPSLLSVIGDTSDDTLSLPTSVVGGQSGALHHRNGWTVAAQVQSDYFDWVDTAIAFHPRHGIVIAEVAGDAYGSSIAGVRAFWKSFERDVYAWNSADI